MAAATAEYSTSRRTGFGAAGWRVISASLLLYFAYAGWSLDGLNVFAGALAQDHGWNTGRLLALMAPGGLMAVVGSALFGHLIIPWGARKTIAVCLIGMAGAVVCFGHMTALWQFPWVFMAINLFGAGFGFIAPGTLIAHWFPRRKAMALAIATCGFPLSSAVFVPLAAVQVHAQGLGMMSTTWALLFLLAAVLAYVGLANTPEEAGCLPDNGLVTRTNDPPADSRFEAGALSIGQLLGDRRAWILGVGWGCLWMITVGIVVQFAPRMQAMGFSEPGALSMLSAAAVSAIPLSLLWGQLDQRLGTRAATLLYGACYLVSLSLLASAATGMIAAAAIILFVGAGLGGIKSLLTSMVVSVYGRRDFSAAYRVVIPMAVIVRTAAFPVMGWALTGARSLVPAYVAFIAVDLVALCLVFLAPRKPQE